MERDEWLRAAWQVMVAEKVEAGRLVFVDEIWAPTPRSMRCMPGLRKERGHTLVSTSEPWTEHDIVLASMSSEGMGSCLAVIGSTIAAVFEAYVEKVLAPSLQSSGQMIIVVMYNLTAHKGERVKELIEERECELLYLPPYSPDFNPIEEAFSKIKGVLRKAPRLGPERRWWRRWAGQSR